MDFSVLLQELEALGLPEDQYAITSSGVLAVHGIREANDLDIIVTASLWEQLSAIYPVITEGNFQTIYINNIQILGVGSYFTGSNFDIPQAQIANADIINGKRFVKLETIKEIKHRRNHEKDQQDIPLINKFLSNSMRS